MNKKTYGSKRWVTILLCLILVAPALSVSAFARDERGRGDTGRGDRGGMGDRGRGGGHREVIVVNRSRYNYHDGRFYRPGWFGFEFLLASPPIGAIVTYLPVGHRTMIVAGTTYYNYDDVYYQSYPSGYIVVPPPPVVNVAPPVVAPAPYTPETVTINVPNSNGSYTPITLIKRGDGYVGPQGEFYQDHPTVEQLRALYGK